MADFIQQGLDALKFGERDLARKNFLSAVKQTPDNERAWSMLYNVAANDQEKLDCLKQVLRINPGNEKAGQMLGALTPSVIPIRQAVPETNQAPEVQYREPEIVKNNKVRDSSVENKILRSVNLFFSSVVFGNFYAVWWISSYLSNTIVGDEKISLWKYVNGEEYGMALGAVELLFVIIARYLIGFGMSFGIFFSVSQFGNFLYDWVTSPKQK